MNKIVWVLVGSAIGAGIGGGVAYLYLNKKYDVIFEKETAADKEEIEELRRINTELQKAQANKLYTKKEDFFKDEKVASNIDPDELISDEEAEEDEYDAEPTKKTGDIRFISKKDFDDDDDYEKEYIEYYMGNSTIVQNDEILDADEFTEVCGLAAFSLLKKDRSLARWSSAGDNELYIRNEQYGVDYKIKREHMDYDG